jgi:glutamate carboxypeptidase
MSVTEFRAYLTSMVADAKRLIECESPSADPDAIARSADEVARVGFARLGFMPDRIEIDGRVHLRWRFGSGPTRVLLLAHHDTVWPLGSLEKNPFAVTGDRLTGPGCFDMKVGIVMAFHALASRHGREGATLLVTGDEEVGSPSSRSLIESEASTAVAVLVLEAAAPGGAVKTERKGASFYEISITGRAAHAGLEPERGVNAVVELAHQVRRIAGLGRPSLGTSVTPTFARGGSTSNTVPESATLAVDVRAWTMEELTRMDRELRALSAVVPGAAIALEGEIGRPPLESDASSRLFDLAQSLAGRLGHPRLLKAAVGGASDGNFTAAMGIPTLDGLGAVGGGAHSMSEHVLIDRLPERTLLLAELTKELLATEG